MAHRQSRSLKWLVPFLYIVFLMLPIYWLLNMSFKTTNEILGTFSLFPHEFTLDNYRAIFTDLDLNLIGNPTALATSTIVTSPASGTAAAPTDASTAVTKIRNVTIGVIAGIGTSANPP